ncbi:hypothetical protein niasHT_010474 [Heterodera trifolii]|uniref:BTB domain-containing protein n=1 Tax=Heterodera trifolii TaxID=157864 RepID=A0ABD2MBE0_9BILA
MSISLADRMKLLLSNGDGADIQFLVGQGEEKEVLKAHKNIMMTASDVFKAMFRFDAQNAKAKTSSSSAEQLQSVEITDIDANVFKVMLSFIYAEDSSGVTGDNLIAVLYAANKYHISLLAKACADFPLENELPNVFLAYEQTQLLDEKDFAIHCLDYIDRNAETLFDSEEFLQIGQNSLSKIFGSDQLKISGEIVLWNTALRWADEKCRQNAIECSPKNRRSALGPALFKIRFPLITMETFAKEIVPSGLLTVEEVLGIYQFNCHPNLRAVSELYPLKFSAQNRASCRQLVLDIEQLSAFAGENEGNKRYSETVYRNGVPWKIRAKINTKKDSTEKWLGFYLLCTASEETKKYHISLLAKACADFPLKNELPNVFLAYEQAQLLDEKGFSIRCLNYIDRKAETLFGSEEFLQIGQNLLSKIFGSDQLKISGEIALWNTALRWADEKCRQNAIECSPENRRSALGPALFKIRFTLITMETFAKEIACCNNLAAFNQIKNCFPFFSAFRRSDCGGSARHLPIQCHPNLRAVSELYPLKFSAQNRASCRQLVLDIEQLSAFAGENEGNKRYSETVYRNGVPWKIRAKINTKKDSTEKWLGFFLLCTAPKEGINWSCKYSAKLQIVSQKSGTEDLTLKFSKIVFNNKSLSWGFPNFISFAELMDPSKGLYDEEGDKVTLAIDFNEDSLYSKTKSFFGKLMGLILRILSAVKSFFV